MANSRPISTRDAFRLASSSFTRNCSWFPNSPLPKISGSAVFPPKPASSTGADADRTSGQARPKSASMSIHARKVASLSIGERQMVEIAKAVMLDARVIALDEPTSSLSSRESEILFSLIDRLRGEGHGHPLRLAPARRNLPSLRQPDCAARRQARRPSRRYRADDARADHRRDGRPRNRQYLGVARAPAWRHALGGRRIFLEPNSPRPIHFAVRKGEILGFFGLIGAGRSEWRGSCMAPMHRLSGHGYVDGETVTADSPAHRSALALCCARRTAS
jgi:L-arabinose transport system ATP-binding protein